jgi:hypothetical protein
MIEVWPPEEALAAVGFAGTDSEGRWILDDDGSHGIDVRARRVLHAASAAALPAHG